MYLKGPWIKGHEGLFRLDSLLAARAPLRNVGPRLIVILANLKWKANCFKFIFVCDAKIKGILGKGDTFSFSLMHNGQPLSMELISKGSVRGNIHKVENLILSEKMPYFRIQKQKNSEIRTSKEFLVWNASKCSKNRMF